MKNSLEGTTPPTHEVQVNLNPTHEDNYDNAPKLSATNQNHTQDPAIDANITQTDEESIITQNMNGDTEIDINISNEIHESPSHNDEDMVT